jgi:hypothetical protein
MKSRALTATRLRLMLSLSLFVIAILTSVILSFVYDKLDGVATEVSHVAVDANASQDNVQTLQKIQKELDSEKDVVARAGDIVADSQSYQYQDQIIGDLNEYADKAGIKITTIDFTASTPAATAPASKSAPAPPAPSGVKSTSVSITLQNPIPYANMLRFIHSIEQNLTKMQISRVGLAKGTGSDSVTSEVLTMQVYIK